MSPDPVGFYVNNPVSFNRYAYANNNPIAYTDPDGRLGVLAAVMIGAGAFLISENANTPDVGEKTHRLSADGLAPGALLIVGGVLVEVGVGAAGTVSAGTGARLVTQGKKGLETRGVKPAPGSRIRPEGIPEGWRIRPTRGKGGTEYYNPKNPNESVRVMQGNPNSPYPNSQKPYVRQRDSSGSYLDANGNRAPNKSSATHIPLDKFRFRK